MWKGQSQKSGYDGPTRNWGSGCTKMPSFYMIVIEI